MTLRQWAWLMFSGIWFSFMGALVISATNSSLVIAITILVVGAMVVGSLLGVKEMD